MNDTGPGGSAEGPLVEHDPTISYEPIPGETIGPGGAIAGAFRYALVVEEGPRAGLTYVLGEGETLAGRSDDVDIFLGDVTVSRHHARFVVDESGLRVEDLGSTNGTYVNLNRLDASPLQPGDRLIIGKFHLAVAGGDA
jgi:pSer/pThr/pTyr-binding forkhead associated (FHA) protein